MAGSVTATLRVQFGIFIVVVHAKMSRKERRRGGGGGGGAGGDREVFDIDVEEWGVFASDLCSCSVQLCQPDPIVGSSEQSNPQPPLSEPRYSYT